MVEEKKGGSYNVIYQITYHDMGMMEFSHLDELDLAALRPAIANKLLDIQATGFNDENDMFNEYMRQAKGGMN